ncbi:MAG TPA: hypothetical protein VF086_13580 [Propionibacteriaceae bacterium]
MPLHELQPVHGCILCPGGPGGPGAPRSDVRAVVQSVFAVLARQAVTKISFPGAPYARASLARLITEAPD